MSTEKERREWARQERKRFGRDLRIQDDKDKVIGTTCWLCDRKAKATHVVVAKDVLRFLVTLVAMWEKEPRWYVAGEVFHGVMDWEVRFYRIKKKERDPKSDAMYLKWWPGGPLLEHKRAEKEDDEELEELAKQKFDTYRPTQRGIHFVRGINRVPFSCWFYQRNLLHKDRAVVSITDGRTGDLNIQQIIETAQRSFDDLKP
jgi:hypothetical protein